jgi:ABC-type amino acid transport substrate-binding protein
LSISFILFAGWFADAAVPVSEYPRLALTGLLTFFGSLSAAVPFLLDLFRIPADTFQLFVATGVINSRFGALLSAVHTVTVALLGSAAILGALRISAARITRYLVVTAVLTAVVIGGLRVTFTTVFKGSFAGEEVVYSMRPLMAHTEARLVTWRRVPARRIRRRIDQKRGVLRVALLVNRLPYVLIGRDSKLVGFDVEMAQILGRDIGVKVEFVELPDFSVLRPLLADGRVDLAMGGVVVTPERAGEMLFSQPYLDETLAFVVKDHLRGNFSTWGEIRELGSFPVAIPNSPYYINHVRVRAPALKLAPLEGMSEIEAETVSHRGHSHAGRERIVLTLLFPKYTVVVPEPDVVKIPLAYPVARRDQNWAQFINTWIELKRRDGTIDALYAHWILGKQAAAREPRWSIMRNWLHWVD